MKFKGFFKNIILFPRKLEIFLIEFYQNKIAIHTKKRCIYYPTCSEYTKQAVDKYGIIKGNVLGFIRIIHFQEVE